MEVELKESKSRYKETNYKGIDDEEAKDNGGLNQGGRTGKKLTNCYNPTLIYRGKNQSNGYMWSGLGRNK